MPYPTTNIPNRAAGEFIDDPDWDELVDALNFLANRPACVLARRAAQSFASGVGAAIQWDTEQVDTAALWTSGTPNRITLPVAGLYSITAGAVFNTGSTAGRRELYFTVGATATHIDHVIAAPSTAAQMLNASRIWKFAAGEYFEVQAFQDSGAAVNVNDASPHSRTFVAVTWIGRG